MKYRIWLNAILVKHEFRIYRFFKCDVSETVIHQTLSMSHYLNW